MTQTRSAMRHNKWFWVRIAIITAGGLQGISIASQEVTEAYDVDWMDCLLMFLFAIFGPLVIIGVQAINPRSAPVWRKPSWEINPFLIREPLQFFHCAAYYSLAGGIVACATFLYRETDVSPFAVALIGIGAGMWLTVKLSRFVFRWKMVNPQQIGPESDTEPGFKNSGGELGSRLES